MRKRTLFLFSLWYQSVDCLTRLLSVQPDPSVQYSEVRENIVERINRLWPCVFGEY